MSKFLSSVRIRFIVILFCWVIMYFFANLQRVGIPGAVFDRLMQHYDCSAAEVAGLGAAFMFTYALMQPLMGLFLDRYGGERVLCIGGGIFCAGELLFACSGNLLTAYTAQILSGIGAGSLYLTLVRENMRIFREKYNFILALIILFGYAGGFAANAPMILVMNRIGFRETFFVSAGCVLFFWICSVILILPGKFQAVRKKYTFSPREFLPVFRLPHNLKLYCFSALNFGLYYVLQTVIGKKFLQDFCEMSDLKSGWIFSATGAIAASGGIMFALLSHISGNRRRVFCRTAGCASILIYGTLLFSVSCGIRNGNFYAALFLILSSTASLSTIIIPLLRETNPENLVNKSISMLNFSFYLAVAFLGNLTGLILNCFTPVRKEQIMIYGTDAWISVFAALFLFSWLVCYFSLQMKETYGKRITL